MAGGGKEIRPDNVAIYIRWSTEDQGDGTTLVVQQEGCQHYVLSQGWRVTPSLMFVDDGHSGGTLDRPRLNELRKAVAAGDVDCVVVYKLDRLSRSVMDTVNLVLGEWEERTHLKSAREPVDTTSPMGKQFFYLLVSYAEWERNVIKERTYSGKLRRAQEGRNPGIPASYGYRKSDQVGLFEIDPEKAEVLRWIFRTYLEECGTWKIADELNHRGVPSPTGLKWHKTTVLNMLKNPIYSGRLVYGRTTVNPRRQRDKSQPMYLKNSEPIVADTQFPAIITLRQFERVQSLISQRHKGSTGVRSLASEYLLTGLLRCRCGATMTSHCTKGKRGKPYFYYLCQARENLGHRACDGALIAQHLLNDAVETKLQELLSQEGAYQKVVAARHHKLAERRQDVEDGGRQATVALEGLDAQVRRLNRDYRSGAISPSLYEENRREIEAERAQLQAQSAEFKRAKESLSQEMLEHDILKDTFKKAEIWLELDISERKRILRHLLDQVVAFKVKRRPEVSIEVFWKFAEPASAS